MRRLTHQSIKMCSIFRRLGNHPDPWLRNQWSEEITKELLKMKMNKVWKKIKRSQMQPGKVCIKYKWVFDIKCDGTIRA
jgi:hypothetical protein